MKIVRTKQGWGQLGRGAALSGPRGLIPVAALGVACSSLLGIEDVHEGPGSSAGMSNAGSGGSATGGNGGTGGATGGSAGKGTGGATGGTTGGSAGKGSAAGGSAGSGTTGGSSGDSGEGGAGNETSSGGSAGKGGGAGKGGSAGSAGSGGSGGAAGDPTVRGKVVDQRLTPVVGVPVMIGDEMVNTDDDGEFEIADVPETYDAKLTVLLSNYTAGWVYEGLTRRDPTLQVYRGDVYRSGNFSFSATNPPPDTSKTVIALGSPYGHYQRDGAGAIGQASFSWVGPPMATATAHGLVWLVTGGLPTAYSTYTVSSSQFVFAETGSTPWTLDFTPNTVNTDTISGTVTTPTAVARTNAVFVQFSSGALITLAKQTGANAGANWSYLVPTLPNATITVMASEGDPYYEASGLAHRSGVTSAQTTSPLAIPTPPSLVAPAGNATIAENTMFSWSATQDTFVWHAEAMDFYEHVYVVTARKSIPMPTFPNGYSLRAGDDAFWRVETHGNATTVDELAGSNGFADQFAPWSDVPEGPRRDAGTFAISLSRVFWTP